MYVAIFIYFMARCFSWKLYFFLISPLRFAYLHSFVHIYTYTYYMLLFSIVCNGFTASVIALIPPKYVRFVRMGSFCLNYNGLCGQYWRWLSGQSKCEFIYVRLCMPNTDPIAKGCEQLAIWVLYVLTSKLSILRLFLFSDEMVCVWIEI